MKPAPVKQDITFDQFQKLDIRVGTISSVEDIADSRKTSTQRQRRRVKVPGKKERQIISV